MMNITGTFPEMISDEPVFADVDAAYEFFTQLKAKLIATATAAGMSRSDLTSRHVYLDNRMCGAMDSFRY